LNLNILSYGTNFVDFLGKKIDRYMFNGWWRMWYRGAIVGNEWSRVILEHTWKNTSLNVKLLI